jgi:hypothetical protein
MNIFFYEDRTGKHLRSYVKVVLVIFAVIMTLGMVAAFDRNQMVSQVMATPRPLDTTLLPTQTAHVEAPAATAETCPSDPANWSLTDSVSVSGSNLKVLGPQCVYDNLEKTAAWVYATTALGYTRADAARALGLQSNILIANLANVTVLTDFNDEPQAVEVISAVNNSKLAEWRVNVNGQTGLEMSFSGCFSTSALTGGQVVSWGNGYPVVCQFFADYRIQYTVSSINDHLYTGESVRNVRRPLWFGYIGDGNWTWLGSGKAWDADLSQLPSQSLNSYANRYGREIWNASNTFASKLAICQRARVYR